MSTSYKIAFPTTHRKIRGTERTNTSDIYGRKTKFKVGFVARRVKIDENGKRVWSRAFEVVIDPTSTATGPSLSRKKVFSSTECYTLTRKQVETLSTNFGIFKAIDESPVNKVDFRWITRDQLRAVRRIGIKAVIKPKRPIKTP